MAYIKLFFTSDDVQVSESPTTTNAVTFTLRADQNEEGTPIGLYAKADTGYEVTTVTITPTGDTATKWALAPDDTGSAGVFGSYGDALALTGQTVDDTTGVPFWIKAKAIDSETPVNDVTVTLVVAGVAAAE
jgi:hypothetical protein